MVLGLVGLALLATLLVSMISPRVYESTASVIAPKEGGGQILGVLGGGGLLQQLGATLPSMTPNRDLLLSVLKSRTMLQSVVDRFQLQDRYRSRHLEDAVNRLRNATALTVSREGAIFVSLKIPIPPRRPRSPISTFCSWIVWSPATASVKPAAAPIPDRAAGAGEGRTGRRRGGASGLPGTELRLIVLQEQTKGAIEAAARLKVRS